jgi:multidrug efflux pump subunit AcrB
MSYRLDPKEVLQIRVRNSSWNTVPLGSFTSVRDVTGPYRVLRYNLYPAAELDGTPAPGYSQGQAIQTMQQLAAETLPGGLTYEWTTFQQMKASNTAVFAWGALSAAGRSEQKRLDRSNSGQVAFLRKNRCMTVEGSQDLHP